VLRKIIRVARPLARLKIGRRGDREHVGWPAYVHGDHIERDGLTEPEAGIEAFRHDINECWPGDRIDGHLWVSLEKCWGDGLHQQRRHGLRCGEPQDPTRLIARCVNLSQRAIEISRSSRIGRSRVTSRSPASVDSTLRVVRFNGRAPIMEPGGARTGFRRTAGVQIGTVDDAYKDTPIGGMRQYLSNPAVVSAGDPAKMLKVMIDSVDQSLSPKRIVLGTDAYTMIQKALTERLAAVEAQKDLASSTDFPADSRHGRYTRAYREGVRTVRRSRSCGRRRRTELHRRNRAVEHVIDADGEGAAIRS
jgi:hypothetical protein